MKTKLTPTARKIVASAIAVGSIASGISAYMGSASAGTAAPIWSLANGLNATVNRAFAYGNAGDVPLAGDWDGNGTSTPGVKRGNVYFLSNSFGGDANYVFAFGNHDATPVVGDWNGDGKDTIGVKQGNTYSLTNTHTAKVAYQFAYGNHDATPVAGDWNGDGKDTIGVKQGNTYSLTNTHTAKVAYQFAYGNHDATPVAGDWNGDGKDTIGVKQGNTYSLTNTHTANVAYQFAYGNHNHLPIAGDWNGDRKDSIGVVTPSFTTALGPRMPVPRNSTTFANLTKPHHDYPSADIPVPTGTPAYAVQGGTVARVGAMGGCGHGVVINTANLSWTYCHGNGVMRVSAGQTVAAGTEIMQTGNSGNSTGPHLHVQVKINGQLRCPQPALAAAWNGTAFDFQKMPSSGCTN